MDHMQHSVISDPVSTLECQRTSENDSCGLSLYPFCSFSQGHNQQNDCGVTADGNIHNYYHWDLFPHPAEQIRDVDPQSSLDWYCSDTFLPQDWPADESVNWDPHFLHDTVPEPGDFDDFAYSLGRLFPEHLELSSHDSPGNLYQMVDSLADPQKRR